MGGGFIQLLTELTKFIQRELLNSAQEALSFIKDKGINEFVGLLKQENYKSEWMIKIRQLKPYNVNKTLNQHIDEHIKKIQETLTEEEIQKGILQEIKLVLINFILVAIENKLKNGNKLRSYQTSEKPYYPNEQLDTQPFNNLDPINWTTRSRVGNNIPFTKPIWFGSFDNITRKYTDGRHLALSSGFPTVIIDIEALSSLWFK